VNYSPCARPLRRLGQGAVAPGRHFAPEHWAVRQRPEWFHPVHAKDAITHHRMRDMLTRALRHEEQAIARAGGTRVMRPRGAERPRLNKHEPDRRSWRLP
jgi:hypothetical protein